MNSIELSPEAKKIQNWVKGAGLLVVAALASLIVGAVGLSIVGASAIGLAALFMVNFGIPVGARYIAVWRQKAMTRIAEVYSEETIREDERLEGERIAEQEKQYKISRPALESAIDELTNQIPHCDEDQKQMVVSQIASLRNSINCSEDVIRQKKEEFASLVKQNNLWVALDRAARAEQKAQGTMPNPEQIQQVNAARAAIKSRLRAVNAGRTIEAMNLSIGGEKKSGALGMSLDAPNYVSIPVAIKQKERV